jgi:NADH:ubiquinone oxidoreductase subunit E
MCTGQCRRGVCVQVDGELFSVTPDNVEDFIKRHIDGRLAK